MEAGGGRVGHVSTCMGGHRASVGCEARRGSGCCSAAPRRPDRRMMADGRHPHPRHHLLLLSPPPPPPPAMARGPPPVTAPSPRVRVRRNGSAETISPPARARIDPDAALGRARPISPAGSAVSAPPSAPMRTAPAASPSFRLASGSGTAPRTRVGPLFHTPSPARLAPRPKGATAANVAAQAPARARVDMSALFPDASPSAAPRAGPTARSHGLTSPPGSAVSAGPAPARPTVRKVQSSGSVANSLSWVPDRRGPSPSPSGQSQGPVVAQAHVHPSLVSPRSPPPPPAPALSTSPLGPASPADVSHITFTRGGQGHARTLSAFASTPRVPRSRSDSNASTPSVPGVPTGATSGIEVSAPPSPVSSAMSKRRSLQSPDSELITGPQALESVSEVGEPTLSLNPTPGRRWMPAPVQMDMADQAVLETHKLEEEAKKDRKILDLEISNRSLLAINEALEATKLQQAQEIRELKRRLRQGIAEGSAEDAFVDDEGSATSVSTTDDSGCEWDEHEGSRRKDAPLKLMEDPALAKLNLRCRKLVEEMTSRARAALAFEPTKSHVGTGGKVLHPAEVAALRANDPDASADDPSLSVDVNPGPAGIESSPLSPADEAHLVSRHTSESDEVSRETSTSDTEASHVSVSISRSHPSTQSRSQIIARVPSHTILPPKVSLRHSTPPPPGEFHPHGLPDGGVLILGSDDADDMQVSVNGGAPPTSASVPVSASLGASTLRLPREPQLKPRVSSIGADISID